MKILFLGGSQICHIKPVFQQKGHKCSEFLAHNGDFAHKCINLVKLFRYNMVYCVSGCDVLQNRALRLALKWHKKVVIHWIGTDVLQIADSSTESRRIINGKCINLAVSVQLQEELEAQGIKSAVVPIFPPNLPCYSAPMPEKHVILSYVPLLRENFYGIGIIKELARHLQETTFLIVANDGRNDKNPLPNIKYLGFLSREDLYKVYNQSSILLRVPEHDGLPVMMIEAQGLGRIVVHALPFPHVISPSERTVDAIEDCLTEILKKKPEVNKEEIEYIREQYSTEKLIKVYQENGLL